MQDIEQLKNEITDRPKPLHPYQVSFHLSRGGVHI